MTALFVQPHPRAARRSRRSRYTTIRDATPGPARERHLHDALNSTRTGYPTATSIHGHSGRSPAPDLQTEEPGHPAGPVWWLHQHSGGALTLAELSTAITDRARDAA